MQSKVVKVTPANGEKDIPTGDGKIANLFLQCSTLLPLNPDPEITVKNSIFFNLMIFKLFDNIFFQQPQKLSR